MHACTRPALQRWVSEAARRLPTLANSRQWSLGRVGARVMPTLKGGGAWRWLAQMSATQGGVH